MATIGIGEDGEYADGFIRPIKEQIHVPFDDPRIPPLAACNYIKFAKPDTRSAYDSGQSRDLQKWLSGGMVYATDLKSVGLYDRVGSSPTSATNGVYL